MFFKAHQEGKIGYKQLTDADLGNAKGNTSHIGLFSDILQFLPNKDFEDTSMFIYNSECIPLGFSFDRIQRMDGRFDAPKIKKGGRDNASVVTVIRDICKENNPSYNWYLFWFALESNGVVFFLFNNHSRDYESISTFVNLSGKRVKNRIERGDNHFNEVLNYLENIVNANSADLISELEVISQTGINSNKIVKQYDINKANLIFKEIGKQGEELVAAYLDKLKFENQLTNFSWFNSTSESGLPFDFTVQDLRQNIIHIDVKSTSFKFEQPMIFSNQEIEFVTQTPNYHIYRVYDLTEEIKHLKICENSKLYMPRLKTTIDNFSLAISANKAKLQTIKLAIPPLMDELTFSNEINLQ